ncbi:methyl-accepting chemotaxis protein [Zoogloea dura]|uniref:PAS domain S-box protein n=1 Tax=Zoogloea dura TaxID=2728840 RepID=A0A848G787_9RHOO|nr:methyl-accepting chemotaxis protein [Zoogloea dura]NML27120.1 PAS domain S-box protein [Zoogloea dura]
MRINQPTTGIETRVPEGSFLYSRTDLKGRIVEVNDDFAAISGFSRDELIGQPHNLVRHPDMPAEAFGDLWVALKDNRTWNGFVKNRRKDGGYYWVHAFVSPVREDGKVVGYQSVRRCPDPKVTRKLEGDYARIRNAAGKGSLTVADGRVLRKGWAGALARLSFAARARLVLLALVLLQAVLIGKLLLDSDTATSSLKGLYADRLIPTHQLAQVRSAMLDLQLMAAGGQAGQARFEKDRKQLKDNWQAYIATTLVADESKLIRELTPLLEQFDNRLERVGAQIQAGNVPAIQAEASALGKDYAPIEPLLGQLIGIQQQVGSQVIADNEGLQHRNLWTAGALVLLVMVALTLIFMALQRLGRDLDSLCRTMTATEQDGDLRRISSVSRGDEIGRIASAYNAMMANIQAIMLGVQAASRQVLEQSGQLAGSSQQVADGAARSSEAASSTAAAVEQVTVAINEVAENVGTAAQVARQGSEEAERGRKTAGQAADEVAKLAETVSATIQTMGKLVHSSEEIGSIAVVIKEIADQTNLLALNAAIEAARAGEQGRGFAVVADEVRKLAERTTGATGQISGIIMALKEETRHAVSAVQTGDVQVRNGVDLARSAQQALISILGSTRHSLDLVGEIELATREQSSAAESISRNVEQIAQMSEESAAAVNTIADSSRQLAAVADVLRRQLSMVKV